MKFKPGDLCVIVSARAYPDFVGRECVLSHRDEYFGEWILEFADGARPSPDGYYTLPDRCLRLKRPPSWDAWIFDTRDVEYEARRQVMV